MRTTRRTAYVLVLLLLAVLAPPVPPAEAAVTSTVIGYSVQGRPIVAYRVGNPNSAVKRVLVGQMHGTEPYGYDAAMAVVRDPGTVRVDLWVVPTVNPDGRALGRRGNAHGVDLNRNFSTGWKYVYGPGEPYYQGPAPWSEPETRVLRDLLDRVNPWKTVIMHQPLWGVDRYALKNKAFHDDLVSMTGMPSKVFSCDGVCRGTAQVWFNATHAGSVITVELASRHSWFRVEWTGHAVVAALGR